MPHIEVVTPFPDHAVPRVWSWIQTFRDRVADDFAPATLEQFVAEWIERAGERRWAVYRDGELGGMVSFQEWSPICGTSHILFKREFWGTGTSVPAIRRIYDGLFQGGIEKILLYAFRDNDTIRSLAKGRLGAQTEGVLRNQTRRGGRLVDMVALGITKEDFYHAMGSSGTSDRVRSERPVRVAQRAKQEDHPEHHSDALAGVAAPSELGERAAPVVPGQPAVAA